MIYKISTVENRLSQNLKGELTRCIKTGYTALIKNDLRMNI